MSLANQSAVADPPALRYMGSKRVLREPFAQMLESIAKAPLSVVDVFAGTGTVCGWLQDGPAVIASDVAYFPLAIARSRLLEGDRSEQLVDRVVRRARELAAATERGEFEATVSEDEAALAQGWRATRDLIKDAEHVGNSSDYLVAARDAHTAGSFRLATLYFSRGYFSTRQAIRLDALRSSITAELGPNDVYAKEWARADRQDWLLAGWLSAASAISNSPGHTAQFLKSNSEVSYRRVKRAWSMDPIAIFEAALIRVSQVGSREWRSHNRVQRGDATGVLETIDLNERVLVYADPPYTKDHYSRLYHMLETLYLYDYPESIGSARARSNRFQSDFSYRSRASAALSTLAQAATARGAALMLSYPVSGLISGTDVADILGEKGKVTTRDFEILHSTLGGSKGRASVPVSERMYLVTPR